MTRPRTYGGATSAVWALGSFVLACALWSYLVGPAGDDDNWGCVWRWTAILATFAVLDLGPRLAYDRWWRQWRQRQVDSLVARGEAFHP